MHSILKWRLVPWKRSSVNFRKLSKAFYWKVHLVYMFFSNKRHFFMTVFVYISFTWGEKFVSLPCVLLGSRWTYIFVVHFETDRANMFMVCRFSLGTMRYLSTEYAFFSTKHPNGRKGSKQGPVQFVQLSTNVKANHEKSSFYFSVDFLTDSFLSCVPH